MARLINADALRQRMYHEAFETDTDMQKWDSGCWIRYKLFENCIDEQPTISPDEVRGVGEITDDDACPVCGWWIPTDDAHDAIFKNEVKFCYSCGTRLRMKGAEDGTTE